MEFGKTLQLNNTEYSLVLVQRGGSAVYTNQLEYVRIGETNKIRKDLSLHKQMENFGFPVAQLKGEGEYDGLSYFIEESLGDKHFGMIFKHETEAYGTVSNESFDVFQSVVVKYTQAQLMSKTNQKVWDNFKRGIHLDIIITELPQLEKKILKRYDQAESRLKIFPFGILHGDLTPFNIYPKGIIDLEDSFTGPVAYDVGSFLEIQDWFPETSEDEFHRIYKFKESQKKKFADAVNALYILAGLPKPTDYREDFNFLKGIWFTVRMQNLPKLQQFRYDLIKSLI